MNKECGLMIGETNLYDNNLPITFDDRNNRFVHYVITSSRTECDDSFVIYLAHLFRVYGNKLKENVMIYTEDNYDTLQHGNRDSIYNTTLNNFDGNKKLAFENFVMFPNISLVYEKMTPKEEEENKRKMKEREIRFGSIKNVIDKVIPIERERKQENKATSKRSRDYEEGEVSEDDEEKEDSALKKTTSDNKANVHYLKKYLKYKIKYETLQKELDKLNIK